MCHFTVPSAMNIRLAISWLVSPWATSRSTSSCLALSGARSGCTRMRPSARIARLPATDPQLSLEREQRNE